MADLFEGRWEIEKLMEILQEWLEEQTNDPKIDYAEAFLEKLELLRMTW